MGKLKEVIDTGFSRRSFLKGMAAVGASAAVVGCGSTKETEYVYLNDDNSMEDAVAAEDLSNAKIYWGSCVHNCGAGVRCVSKFHVVNGRIVRVTSDDSDKAFDGSTRDKEQYNDSRALTCPKGHAFKFRVYQSGRLRYALKQTKQRGDMTGFIRIPVEQAVNEITRKYRAIQTKYGTGAIQQMYGSSGGYGTYANYGSTVSALSYPAGIREYYSDYSYHQYHYGQPLVGHPGAQYAYSKPSNVAWQFPAIAGVVKNVVSWGTNFLSTVNSSAWGYIRSFEKLKARGGKAYFIGPELTDTGVVCHTDWVQLRNYTDTALIMGMLHEMLINTFDTDGSIKAGAWLDVDYIDTMVYGFFASPEYWLNKTTGVITLGNNPADGSIKVEAVPAGRSLADYIMGSDERLKNANYTAGNSYTAARFGNIARGAKCSWPAATRSGTKYLYKQQMSAPKTAEWASAICGTPVDTIKALAKMYCDPNQHPIFNEWAGGLQKQMNGVINIWAVQALMCITKTFGLSGETFSGAWAATLSAGPVGDPEAKNRIDSTSPAGRITGSLSDKRSINTSCKEWFNGIKLAFADVLKTKGYTAKYIPDWNFDTTKTGRFYSNDGGVKTGVLWSRDASGDLETETIDGKQYYKYEKDGEGNPIYVGTRMCIQGGGGILVNQHMNTNDTVEMYKLLPLSGDPDSAENLCLVQIDLFMSPSARYADYVLPGVSSLEAVDTIDIGGQTGVYRPMLVKPVGDAQDSWRMTFEAYRAQSDLGEYSDLGTTTGAVGSHLKYVGTDSTSTKGFKPIQEYFDERVKDAIANTSSIFYGKTVDEVCAMTFRPAKNQPEYIVSGTAPYYETRGTATVNGNTGANKDDISVAGQIRKNLDAYLALPVVTRKTTPFVCTTQNGVKNEFVASTFFITGQGGGDQICPEIYVNRPNAAQRFQVYNGMLTFDYTNLFSKYHGWLPEAERGQKNADPEGDFKVYPIPMYFNFEDCFNEMYGVFNGKTDNDLSKKKGLTLGTTHDRFRVHSTHNENPFLRELNHRTKNGGWASANDWNEYCVVTDDPAKMSLMISNAVSKKNMKTASWHEIWMNTEDAAERNIVDGDLIRVSNPIGAVRVIARVTDRCVKGHVNLHQGGWYDPNPIDGIDDGGCANTLIPSYPSRIDHGNAQQMCYVVIEKETGF